MRVVSVRIYNYRSIENLDMQFEGDGIHALLGTPGAGKSSVLGAIAFALYGDPGPGIDLVDVRYDKAADKAVAGANVTWQHGGDTYRCVRELRRGTRGGKIIEKASARMWHGDTELEGVTPTAMTAEVTKILGMGARAFRGANYIAQGEVDALTTATPSEVAALIEEHTGVAALTKQRDHARKDASDAQARADGLRGDPEAVATAEETEAEAGKALTAAGQEHQEAKAKADRARTMWDQSNALAEQLREQERRARTSREALVAAEAVADSAAKRRATAEALLTENGLGADSASRLDAETTRLAQTIQQISEHGTAHGRAVEAVQAAEHELGQARHTASQIDVEAIAADLAAATGERDTLMEKMQQTHTDQRTQQAEADKLAKSVRTLRDAAGEAHCPTCRQSIADVSALAADLDGQRQAAADAAAQAAQQAQELASAGRQCDATIQQLQSRQRDADMLEQRIRDLTARLDASHTAAEGDRTALIALVNTACPGTVDADAAGETVHEAAREAHRTLTEQSRKIAADQQAVAAAIEARREAEAARDRVVETEQAVLDAVDPQQLASAEQAAAEARASFDAANQVASDARAVYSAAQAGNLQATNEADIARSAWDAKRTALRTAEERRGVADTLAALRQDVLADAVEQISDAATDLLQQFGGEHVAFHLDSDFVPCVELVNGELRKTKLLSGGEKARAGLAFRLGIAMQAADGRLPDQIFGDEVTQYLDDEGRRAIVETISALFAAPILISHTSEIHDYATTVHHLERDPLGATRVADMAV